MKHFTVFLLILSLLNLGSQCSLDQSSSMSESLPSAHVTADKMNMLYVGIDNPISISAVGINSNELKVSCSGGGCKITKNGKFNHNVRVSQPGQTATITLSGGGLKASSYKFRVKRMPDPKPCLCNCNKSKMGVNEFKGQKGIYAKLENMDITGKCTVDNYEITRIPFNARPIVLNNQGGRFSSEAEVLKNKAQPGDIYCYTSIKVRCPGDRKSRSIPDIVMKIK